MVLLERVNNVKNLDAFTVVFKNSKQLLHRETKNFLNFDMLDSQCLTLLPAKIQTPQLHNLMVEPFIMGPYKKNK